jgi:thiamine monophosphate synthase
MKLLAISAGIGWERGPWTEVLCSGVDAFLIREKQLEAKALLDLTRWCQDTAPGLELWIADRLDVALATGCGLHAGEAYPEVPPTLVALSRPIHGEQQAPTRLACGQWLVSPLFSSPGKGAPWGRERFHRFLDALPAQSPSILALGGITADSVRELRHPRLAGLAAIRPFWQGDPRRVVAGFREA